MGLILYEYMYGMHPFQNKQSKIMAILIKRYPVIFPEAPSTSSDFQDLLRDLLNKDPE